jgi:hypothetical protein
MDEEILKSLVKNEQSLLDAIAIGDKNVWAKYLHDSCLITLETSGIISKQKFIDSLKPLPKGYVGHINVINPRYKIYGNTAVLSFVDDEYLELYNQKIHTQYLQTDTWIKEKGEWKLIAMQLFEIPKNPKPIQCDSTILKQYTGSYYLSNERTCTVKLENGRLMVKKGESNPQELFAQTEQVFFRNGDGRVDIIFLKNDYGSFNMIERREGEDLVWKKMK